MAQVIYQQLKPPLCIMKDSLQWILSSTRIQRKNGTTTWENRTFHPTLSCLLDELAEVSFRKNARKIKELRKLDEAISKTYSLIAEVAEKNAGSQ